MVVLMALQIANPALVAKVDRLARAIGLTKTAVVERAIDLLASQTQTAEDSGRMAALLAIACPIGRMPSTPWNGIALPKSSLSMRRTAP